MTLRAVATLSFSKFLCVSSQFCDANHRLLFRILETSRDANIRSNIAIALGDVAVSFNTIVDENSDELYRGLSDQDLVVKKNTLMVLTHLILNGMIKVKGQLGEMAKCLEDKEPRIADLAKLFFKDLSTKDNAIYNNLPDVISHLSIGEHAMDEDGFQSTMRYIFTFIEKEKQAESIVEKLCQRFRLTEDTRQWRDIAFCLSLLPFKSERSVNKLIEGLPFYRDKLHEDGVFTRFQEIFNKARSNKTANKSDSDLNEFEAVRFMFHPFFFLCVCILGNSCERCVNVLYSTCLVCIWHVHMSTCNSAHAHATLHIPERSTPLYARTRPIFLLIYPKISHFSFVGSGLDWSQVLKEYRKQGEEDQVFEKHVEGKKAAAKKRATRRTARKRPASVEDEE